MGCGVLRGTAKTPVLEIATVPDETTQVITFVQDIPEAWSKLDATSTTGIAHTHQVLSSGNGSFDYTLAIVAEVPAFRLMAKADMVPLVRAMATKEHAVDEVIIEQGATNDKLFIVLFGEAKVTRSMENTKATLATLRPGDYFGEQEMIHEERARATVKASGSTAAALITTSISHNALRSLGLDKYLRIPKRHAMIDWKSAKRLSMHKTLPGMELMSPEAPKASQDKEFLSTALRRNTRLSGFCTLTDDIIEDLVAVASLHTIDAGEVLMRQGDFQPTSLYIVQHGSLELRSRPCDTKSSPGDQSNHESQHAKLGDCFGERELIHSAPASCTVTTVQETSIWVIEAFDFNDIMSNALQHKIDGYVDVLRDVEIFSGLLREEQKALAEVITELSYVCGQNVITQGQIGNTFFVLVEGSAVAVCDGLETRKLFASREHRVASYFGEMELVRPQRRTASIRITSDSATVLALPEAGFELVLEPYEDLMKAIAEKPQLRPSTSKRQPSNTSKRVSPTSASKQSCPRRLEQMANTIARDNLQLCGRLGSGGFGFVDLAVDRHTNKQFALKRVFRDKVMEPYQQTQLLAEKAILRLCHSPFIITLHGTFRDASTLAFLLEFTAGGDLMDALFNFKLHGNADSARFFCAGIILAIAHLHDLNVMFRDLKPENILLDSEGWPKLTDFGLAKMNADKSFTCCGTPCYMAPEMWLRIGHGKAIDWWALGVLVYEIMSGHTPFENDDGDDDAMREAIEQGISSPSTWSWPEGFDVELREFVAGLLKPYAPQRLPMREGGLTNIKHHPWYTSASFDWVSYEIRSLKPPHVLGKPLEKEDLPPTPDAWIESEPPTSTWDAEF